MPRPRPRRPNASPATLGPTRRVSFPERFSSEVMCMRVRLAFVLPWILVYWLAPAPGALAAEGLVLFPSECKLTTPESRQPLIVHEIQGGEVGRQHASGIEWSSSDSQIATVEGGIVT